MDKKRRESNNKIKSRKELNYVRPNARLQVLLRGKFHVTTHIKYFVKKDFPVLTIFASEYDTVLNNYNQP